MHEHAAGAAGGVVDGALERRQDLHQQVHHTLWRVELAGAGTFLEGKLAEEVLINLSEHIPAAVALWVEAELGQQLHQLAELAGLQL
ncbi:hypothetical protein D3C71_1240420 [compost metagenome]